MPRLTAREGVDKWAKRTTAAQTEMKEGVMRTTEAPGQKAAAAQDRLVNAWLESVNSGKWADAVSSVSLQDWQKAMIDKGAPRVSAGVSAAKDKMVAIYDKLYADIDAVVAEVNRLPNASFEERLARMTSYARGMHDRS